MDENNNIVETGAEPVTEKKKGKKSKIIGVLLIIIGLLLLMQTCNDRAESNPYNSPQATKTDSGEIVIEYNAYTVDDLTAELKDNALVASETHMNEYVEITGRLANIDAQGAYIDVLPANDPWAFTGVQCYIKSDEVKDVVRTLSMDSTVTVKGKITEVGEIFSYQLDIDEIVV